MRRCLTLIVALLALAALVCPVAAQPALLGPGGTVVSSGASVSISNSSTATSIFSWTVAPGLTQGNFAPLHLKLLGYVSTSLFPGAVNVGCNFGGSTATISLLNGITPTASLTSAPIVMDVWVTGYTNAQANGIKEYMQGRFGVVQSAGTETVYGAEVNGTTPVTVANALTCTWQWGSASSGNAVVFPNGVLVVGQ